MTQDPRIDLVDFFILAEPFAGASANQLARMPRVVQEAEAALAAPYAGFGEVELFPTTEEKAAIYASRIIRHHPLVDGNKRSAWVTMQEFIERSGRGWQSAPGDEDAEVFERLAAGTMEESRFIAWVGGRIL